MKKKLILIALSTCLISFCQTKSICGMVEYQETFKSNEEIYNYKLYFNGFESIYFSVVAEKKDEYVETVGGMRTPEIEHRYYTNVKENLLVFQEGIAFEKIITIDNINKIEWNIEAETKIIGSYNCKKATAKYKGVDYIVWFTPDISVPFGPWKFRGLDGLILECYDINNFYHIQANKINLKVDCKNKVERIETKNAVLWEKYVDLKKNEDKDIANYFNRLLGRESNVGVSSESLNAFQREVILENGTK